MIRVLLLNADWSPLKFISDIRGIKLLLKGRAEVIVVDKAPSVWNEYMTTPTFSYRVPATIRLLVRVNSRATTAPRFRKKILYNRDNWSCQYCSKQLGRGSVTIDHVVPRCMGGKTTWKNCVVSCKNCNKIKGNKFLHETDMTLKKQPDVPSVNHFWELQESVDWHNDWYFFVQPSM